MNEGSRWPAGRGVLSLTFDNLGEAAELELGAVALDSVLGAHDTATRVLPSVLESLEGHGVPATFFVEGLNTELYSEQLAAIDGGGHELAYHAWRHERWAGLSATEQSENLARGLAGFGKLGLRVCGLRPPGGGLGPNGVRVVREAGLHYCSPAGKGAGEQDGIALLPFAWRHVDASCVLPPLAAVREQISGSSEPLDAEAFLAHLERELRRLAEEGGYMAIVLHLFMFDWLGAERLERLLEALATASRSGDLWVARCGDVAEHVLADRERFRGGTSLDDTTWAGT